MIEIVDVGASACEGKQPYHKLVEAGRGCVTGFDLNGMPADAKNQRYFGLVVADGKRHVMRTYGGPAAGLSSLLPFDRKICSRFRPLPEPISEIEIETVKLDQIAGLERIDFLHADCQGSELMVLQGGLRKLSRTVAIQIEMAYLPIYVGQAPLGVVDMQLRSMGFMPARIVSQNVWSTGNVVDADFLYVRDVLNSEQSEILAEIMGVCYPAFGGV